MTAPTDEAFPELTEDQLNRLRSYGHGQAVTVGEELFHVGDATYDLILVDGAKVEIVREATTELSEAVVVARFGPGSFIGELGLLTGQASYLTARVSAPGVSPGFHPPSFGG